MDVREERSSQVVEAKRHIREVRDRILAIVTRMEDITLQQLPRIRADYALKIGCWEKALLEAEVAGRRARRRLALAQAQANRGEAPEADAIEQKLDEEMADWMLEVEAARAAYERAMSFLAGTSPLSKADSAELKRLYRTLMMRLHPDVCHADGGEVTELFSLAQNAYRNGDVEMLRSLEAASRHLEPQDDLADADDLAELLRELELDRIEEGVMRERLQELENGEEMRLGRLLADPEWVTARTMELRRAVEGWERVRRDCDERLRALREGFDGR
ncbi:MAG: J domain-containing protein [Olsenella sp.]|nr:J domain-containing protein [Olsenella sp.]